MPWAGVLLALPVLRRHRVLEVFSGIYESLGLLAFYGLQTMVTVMVFLALWRVKRPEHLKGLPPWDLGRALGLPRVPEVKTVRRKLAQLAAQGQARAVMIALAEERIRQEEDLLGYLYVDGHVREYSGHHDLGQDLQDAASHAGASDHRHLGERPQRRPGVPGDLGAQRGADSDAEARCSPRPGSWSGSVAGSRWSSTAGAGAHSCSSTSSVTAIDLITYRKGTTKDVDSASFAEAHLYGRGPGGLLLAV